MSNYYPTQLRSFVNKLHGFSQTTVKLSPLSGTLNAGPRQNVVVSLPPNSLILPESFTMWARAQTSGSMQNPIPNVPGGAAPGVPATSPTVQLPCNAESLIQSLSITANGQSLDAGPGNVYNQLFNLIADVQRSSVERRTKEQSPSLVMISLRAFMVIFLLLLYPQPYLLHLQHNSIIICRFPQSIPLAM
jgi:hypothetical protein